MNSVSPLIQAAIINNLTLFRDIADIYPCSYKCAYTQLEDLKLTQYIDELDRILGSKLRKTIVENDISHLYCIVDFDKNDVILGNRLYSQHPKIYCKIITSLMDQLSSDIIQNDYNNFQIFFKLFKYYTSNNISEKIDILAKLAIDHSRKNIIQYITDNINNYSSFQSRWFTYALQHQKLCIIDYFIKVERFVITKEQIDPIIDTKDINAIVSVFESGKWNITHSQKLFGMGFDDSQIMKIISTINVAINTLGELITYISINRPDLLEKVIRVHSNSAISAYVYLDTEVDITKFLDEKYYNVLLSRSCLIISSEVGSFSANKSIDTKVRQHCENIIRKYIRYALPSHIPSMFIQLINMGLIDIAKQIDNIPHTVIDSIFDECINNERLKPVSIMPSITNIKHGFSITRTDRKRTYCILDSIEIVEYLISLGAKVTSKMFIEAIRLDNIDVVKLLFKHKNIQQLEDYNEAFDMVIGRNDNISSMLYYSGKVNTGTLYHNLGCGYKTYFENYSSLVITLTDIIGTVIISKDLCTIIIEYITIL